MLRSFSHFTCTSAFVCYTLYMTTKPKRDAAGELMALMWVRTRTRDKLRILRDESNEPSMSAILTRLVDRSYETYLKRIRRS